MLRVRKRDSMMQNNEDDIKQQSKTPADTADEDSFLLLLRDAIVQDLLLKDIKLILKYFVFAFHCLKTSFLSTIFQS